MNKWAQGTFKPKNLDKYIGDPSTIMLRSSWEYTFAAFCDNHPSIKKWASESLKIPYYHPIKQKQSIYVPDFLIVYNTRENEQKVELIEIKPYNQTVMEMAKTDAQKAVILVNYAKWASAINYCKHQSIEFRILTENDIYKNYTIKPKTAYR